MKRSLPDHLNPDDGGPAFGRARRLETPSYRADTLNICDDDQLPFGLGSFAGDGSNDDGALRQTQHEQRQEQRNRWLACCHQSGNLGVALYDRVTNEVRRGRACRCDSSGIWLGSRLPESSCSINSKTAPVCRRCCKQLLSFFRQLVPSTAPACAH